MSTARSVYPRQGHWNEEDYLALETNHLVEFEDGCLEFLSMPTRMHQLLLLELCDRLREYVRTRSGQVLIAPYRVRLRPGKFREPDILYLSPTRPANDRFSEGADLVLEILSSTPVDRHRDLVDKRLEYAAAGIPEYWMVDPERRTITVLMLDADQYRVHGEYKPGETAMSVLLTGFQVDVAACFAAAEGN